MDENCSSESLYTQVMQSYDEKHVLDDESRPSRSHAVADQQTTGTDMRSKRDFIEREISTRTDDQKCNALLEKTTTAVCFSIEMDKTCARQPPERFLGKTRYHKNTTLTLESLNDKQVQAEKRRKQQIQEKLQRIHDRQESARKIAENVDILLQQRALAMGVVGENAKRLPSRKIMATANEVAKNFRDLTKQLNNDLSLKERINMRKSRPTFSMNETKMDAKKLSTKFSTNEARVPSKKRENSTSQNVSFTVEVPSEVKKNSKRPVLSAKQKKMLTIADLEEKQRQAEERRNERMERRVKRVKENREALMKMAIDLERFESLQQTIESSPVSTKQVKETALLAEKIADGFDRLSKRYNEDLKRANSFSLELPYVIGP